MSAEGSAEGNAFQRAIDAEARRAMYELQADMARQFWGDDWWTSFRGVRYHRNVMPEIVLFPRLKQIEVARRRWKWRWRWATERLRDTWFCLRHGPE